MKETYTLETGASLLVTDTFLSISFEKPRHSLSTAIFGGGFKEIRHAVNQKLTEYHDREDQFPGGSIPAYLEIMLKKNGFDPKNSCALLTSARMDYFSHTTRRDKELIVEVITTGGVEKTAARAASAPLYGEDHGRFYPVGTINITVIVNGHLLPNIMARTLITITEAKTAALQDLGIADVNNGLPATGTATDGITLITNPAAAPYTDAGTFSVFGSLVAKGVHETVTRCLTAFETPWNQFASLRTPQAVDVRKIKERTKGTY